MLVFTSASCIDATAFEKKLTVASCCTLYPDEAKMEACLRSYLEGLSDERGEEVCATLNCTTFDYDGPLVCALPDD